MRLEYSSPLVGWQTRSAGLWTTSRSASSWMMANNFSKRGESGRKGRKAEGGKGQRSEGGRGGEFSVFSFQLGRVARRRRRGTKGKAFLTTKYTKHTKIKNIGERKHSTFNAQHSEGIFSFKFLVFSWEGAREGVVKSQSFEIRPPSSRPSPQGEGETRPAGGEDPAQGTTRSRQPVPDNTFPTTRSRRGPKI